MRTGLFSHRGRGPKNWQRSDSRIYEDVCEMLERHDGVDASEVEVSVHDGVVTLKGEVEDRPMKRAAEDAVELVAGVKDIQNHLSIKHTWVERMVRAAAGAEATRGDGLLGGVPRNSGWRPGGWFM